MGTSPPRETVMSTTALKFLALAGVVCSQQYNYDINNPQPFNFQYRGTGQSNYVGPDPTTYKFDPYKQVRYDFDLNNPLKAFRYQYKHQFDKAIDAKPNVNIDPNPKFRYDHSNPNQRFDFNFKYDPSNLNLDVPKPYKYEMKRDPNFVYRFDYQY